MAQPDEPNLDRKWGLSLEGKAVFRRTSPDCAEERALTPNPRKNVTKLQQKS
jgi:hypothetical protein